MLIRKPQVVGSSPTIGSPSIPLYDSLFPLLSSSLFALVVRIPVRIA